MGKVSTTHYKIFDYWKNKSFHDVLDDQDPTEMVVFDWGEPSCWACGRPACRKAEEEAQLQEKCKREDGTFDYASLWNNPRVKSELNRCHIKPAALGGKDEPSNLFLLCEECHLLSPDTINVNSFFRWVLNRRKDYCAGKLSPSAILRGVEAQLKERGLPSVCEILSTLDKGTFDPFSLKRYAYNSVGLHANTLSDSSIIAITTDWLASLWLDTLLE